VTRADADHKTIVKQQFTSERYEHCGGGKPPSSKTTAESCDLTRGTNAKHYIAIKLGLNYQQSQRHRKLDK